MRRFPLGFALALGAGPTLAAAQSAPATPAPSAAAPAAVDCDSVAARYAADSTLTPTPPAEAVFVAPQPADMRHLPRGTFTVHYTVTPAGRVDTASVRLEGSENPRHRVRMQQILARGVFPPATAHGCAVPHRMSVTFSH